MSLLTARDVVLSFGGATPVLDHVDVDLFPGAITALIGPNGAGKSTLFGVLAGDLRPDRGQVLLDGKDIASFSPKELARRRAVLPQDNSVRFSYSVDEIVRLARLSHPVNPEYDQRIVTEAIQDVEMSHLRNRDVQTLSGGEMGRTAFARVLAQTTQIILLDEPTAALDLRHQESVLRRARALRDEGHCVVVVLHDLNLAAAYADRVILMNHGKIVSDGTAKHVLTASNIEAVYRQPVIVTDHPTRGCPLIVPTDSPLESEDRKVPSGARRVAGT